MKKKKIAHLQLLPLLSGVQNVTLQELERLDNNEYEKFIICKESGPLCLEAERNSIDVIFCKYLCREIHPLKDLFSIFSLYVLFRKHRFDIVHTHSAKTGFVGRVAAKLAGVKTIIHTVHGFPFDTTSNTFVKAFYVLLEKVAASFSTYIVCLHDSDKNICEKKLGISPAKIKVIPNGVDLEKFKPLQVNEKKLFRSASNIGIDSFVFVMVGRLWVQKNPTVFIKAAIEVIKENIVPDITFLVVGDGELKCEIEVLIRGYEKNILMLGWKNNVSEYLKMSDVFVLPSLWEGMPLATLEAQATGLPCIVSNVPGNLSTVTEGVDGFTFPPMDVIKLKFLMLKMLDNELRERLSVSAREKIEKSHNITERVKIIKSLYDNNA